MIHAEQDQGRDRLRTVSFLLAEPVWAQSENAYVAPRTPDGNPDLNGIWQALGSAHWDLEGHAAWHRLASGFAG